MSTAAFSHQLDQQYTAQPNVSVFTKFKNWCIGQEKDRLLWVGIALAGHGCVITPLTVMAVLLSGANLFLLVAALASMGIALVTNLAAQPTKITIPAFLLSVVIDVAIIIASISMGMDIAKTYI